MVYIERFGGMGTVHRVKVCMISNSELALEWR
jgi:hypothetical protein